MGTVVEASIFQKLSQKRWSEDGRSALIDRIAANSMASDVIPGADGRRKLRWRRAGTGKSGGARVIQFNRAEQEVGLLEAAYAKADRANMIPAEVKKVV